jgi:hypothetical protein
MVRESYACFAKISYNSLVTRKLSEHPCNGRRVTLEIGFAAPLESGA